MRPPYLAHLDEPLALAGRLRCFVVDGEWIRNWRDVDFTNGGHCYTRPYIPTREIWVDREAPGAGELAFIARHQIRERELMRDGAPYLRALAVANRVERRERWAARRRWELCPEAARRRVRRLALGSSAGATVWLVDGRAVRDHFDPNFTQGGHGLRYRFIPRRQIWVDDAVVPSEREFTVAHEAHELTLMRNGMSYDEAHEHALSVERALRAERVCGLRSA
jgi:hypothetical protein